jgi:hypothetical protein
LGEPFSHPLAHIHVNDHPNLRFALDGGNAGNIIVDFLEFIYRMYVPTKWVAWAKQVWFNSEAKRSQIEEDFFTRMVEAFASAQFHLLRDDRSTIERLKRVLRQYKDSAFDLACDSADRELFEYPSGR